MKKKKLLTFATLATAAVLLVACGQKKAAEPASSSSETKKAISITNVSYDPTRELYAAYNKVFQKYWKAKEGQDVTITQSHGGSGKQANSVIEGNEADVVTLALEQDITSIQDAGLIDKGWKKEFPDNSSPYTSTIVFLVRKDNPKNIKDWDDLTKSGVGVITPNPKTGGGARWNYLAAWAYANKKYNGNEKKDIAFEKSLYKNVLVLDSGARAATTTFVENGQGDVLISWENEAYLALKEHPGEYEIITPSISIKAEPSVAVVDAVAKKRGTEKVAKAYLNYLYSDEGQKLAAENFYRPINKKIAAEYADKFAKVNLVTIDDKIFGGWPKVQEKHFADGAIFDQIYAK
ncbi:sulfate ABC transporter substrate-binding protein [Lactococcus insecticola]|uniref:Sulfate transporter subunit n=1 Tax=Pseudolactococcus insecticola TaxID=2709158 RepID=A0A6A0B3L3_9LACT|nr:sulfate ABC transporter substrate-binding protein [Lactococcus insecticola]GFH39919.1 sulfate transporter subunit [Lactococcus insecticola]